MITMHPDELIVNETYTILSRVSPGSTRCMLGRFIELKSIQMKLFARFELRGEVYVDVPWKSILKLEAE